MVIKQFKREDTQRGKLGALNTVLDRYKLIDWYESLKIVSVSLTEYKKKSILPIEWVEEVGY